MRLGIIIIANNKKYLEIHIKSENSYFAYILQLNDHLYVIYHVY